MSRALAAEIVGFGDAVEAVVDPPDLVRAVDQPPR
jgi:hypothetical protein